MDKGDQMSVAIYVRVSTALQIDNTSLDIQVDLCKKRALELGFLNPIYEYTVKKVQRERI